MSVQLIVALDFNCKQSALNLVEQLDPKQCALKVGSELFTLFGVELVKQLVNKQFKVFLDLKFHDIPNTVANACKAAADLGVWMVNVHASGGIRMMQAAKDAIDSYGADKPILIAVTVLTSFNETDLNSIGICQPVSEHVNKLAFLTKEAGLDGVVSSAYEAKSIKNLCGSEFITVTPGIRLADDLKNDQTRIMTPQEAINSGSDYLVIGRPITQSIYPMKVITQILKNIHSI